MDDATQRFSGMDDRVMVSASSASTVTLAKIKNVPQYRSRQKGWRTGRIASRTHLRTSAYKSSPQSARSENGITYGIYSAGISDEQKRGIVDQIRLLSC